MSFWTAIVVIIAIVAVTGMFRGRSRSKAEQRAADPTSGESELAAKREVEELRERIKVLERIATDANTSEARKVKAISDEIESLKEK